MACRLQWCPLVIAAALICLPAPAAAQQLPVLKVPASVYELKPDGSGWKAVFQPEGYVRIGSLRLSPDGSRLSFDGLTAEQGWSEASLLSCRLDGTDLKNHGPGAMPTYSPDGKRISYCHYGSPYGVRILNVADGKSSAVESAWGVQWSPMTNEIAYVRGGEVVVRDLDSGVVRSLFPEGRSPYQTVHYNMAWSADGKRLAVQGRRPEGLWEVAILDAQGAEFGFEVACPVEAASNFLAWHPSGREIAFQTYRTPNGCSQINKVDLEARPRTPVPMAGQPVDFDNVSMCWTADGSRMLVISWQRKEPVDPGCD